MKNGVKERLEKETAVLKERYDKLNDFLWTDKVKSLSARQQELLSLQEIFMSGYLEVLELRLKYWGNEE